MSPDHHTSERVYRALKSELLANQLQADLLNITMLSHRYGSSATPVREALLRLVGEGIVWMPPGGGFAPVRLAADQLKELYDLNMRLLLMITKIAEPLAEPREQKLVVSDIQPPVDALFLSWSEQSGNKSLAALIRTLNDRLHSARLLESKRLPRLDIEYERLRNSSGAEVRSLIVRYHRRRMSISDLLSTR